MTPISKSVKFEQKLIDEDAIKTIHTINNAGYEAYLVGGCVRDLLLGLKPKDFDVVTNAKPLQVRKLFRRSCLIGKRFKLVHVIFRRHKIIEVATFRAGKIQTAKSGIIINDNNYGTITEDVMRRDFSINALYYDIKNKQIIDYIAGLKDIAIKKINMIGEPALRFKEDPVRIIRAIRFQVKLDALISTEIEKSIYKQAYLLASVSPARLYDECIKLFHNEKSLQIYEQLEKYGVLKYLCKQTKKTDFIKKTLTNTSLRIKENKPVTPVFIFAVFLWQAWNKDFSNIKKQKSSSLAIIEASDKVIMKQIKQVSLPKWLIIRIKDIWAMQVKLEKIPTKKVDKLLMHPGFRIAYDFLLLRSKSINPELSQIVKFWTKAQR